MSSIPDGFNEILKLNDFSDIRMTFSKLNKRIHISSFSPNEITMSDLCDYIHQSGFYNDNLPGFFAGHCGDNLLAAQCLLFYLLFIRVG